MNDYFSPLFFKYFSLIAFQEGRDRSADKIDDNILPNYFIIVAIRT